MEHIYREYFGMPITEAEIHPEVMDAVNRDGHKHYRFANLTATVRKLAKKGQSTGLSDDKPKKGSSRAVYFPEEAHPAKIDGQETKIPHVLKVAFSGTLDKHLPNDHPLLGQMQNQHEIDHSHHYSVLQPVGKDDFKTNPEGFLPPLIDHHADGHWAQVGKIDKLDSKTFKEATKTADFPKGITHKDFYHTVNHEWEQSNGRRHYSPLSEEHMEKIADHPLVRRAINFCIDTDTHPGDFAVRNMGVWHHPVTGEKHIVAADAGFSRDVAKAYNNARENMRKKNRGW